MNNLTTLRDHLFATLQGVKDGNITIEKAKAISELSQVIVNTAKIEVDYIRANGGGKTDFLTSEAKQITSTPNGMVTVNGASTVHKLRG